VSRLRPGLHHCCISLLLLPTACGITERPSGCGNPESLPKIEVEMDDPREMQARGGGQGGYLATLTVGAGTPAVVPDDGSSPLGM